MICSPGEQRQSYIACVVLLMVISGVSWNLLVSVVLFSEN